MTKKTVRVLLDVDGVLNGVGNCPKPSIKFKAKGFQIECSIRVVEFIKELAAMDHVEIHWLTTWCDLDVVENIGNKLGLPEFKVCFRDRTQERISPVRWFKLPLAQQLYESDNLPFVWLDDDLRWEYDAREWLAELPFDKYLAVAPETSVGLTTKNIDTIRKFVQAWA